MGERTYKQLNWTSRIKLETMLKHGHSKKKSPRSWAYISAPFTASSSAGRMSI